MAVVFPQTIKKRKTFLELSKNGSCYKTRGVIILSKKTHSDDIFVGYTASKKVGNAVVRNFAKRRMRHLVREFFPFFEKGTMFVLIATKYTISFPFSELRLDFLQALKKVQAYAN